MSFWHNTNMTVIGFFLRGCLSHTCRAKKVLSVGKKCTAHKNTECPVQGTILILMFPENMSPNRRQPQLNYLWVKVADKRAATNLKYYFEVFFIKKMFIWDIFTLNEIIFWGIYCSNQNVVSRHFVCDSDWKNGGEWLRCPKLPRPQAELSHKSIHPNHFKSMSLTATKLL